jgi:outer membrane protein OmpA-like peptidoglycan-associated protein/tetratricopeptide (TPR) repeat protein
MKRIHLIIILFSIQLINAQTQDLQRAKRYFDRTFYSEAIPLYNNIIKGNRSVEVVRNLGDCYYYTNDYTNAQRQYRFLVENLNNQLGEEYYFRYSQTLKATGNYEEANSIMRDYLIKSNNTKALGTFEKENQELENVTAIGNRFEIKNLAINTANSEFGGVKQGDNLVFSAVKQQANVFDKVYKWNNELYLDLLTIPLKNTNSPETPTNYLSKELNTDRHEANAIFTKDGKTMYFTRNNPKRTITDKNKVSNLQIFKAEFVDGKWTNITSLPFNSTEYSVEHPALSSDEKTLYFASDMPGTLGSFDIFSVSINAGAFGTPKNLGDTINTRRKEQFPFVSKDNKLYFSSNGHAGYGSLDVFESNIQNNTYSKPVNVGLPVNSGYDDFSFNMDSDSKMGYFSSNRLGGKGNDDIYEVKETKPLVVEDCVQFITGIITDTDTKLPLENTLVLLQNSAKVEVQQVITSQDGKFSFAVACQENYLVSASKEGYTKDSKTITVKKERNKIHDASMSLRSQQTIKKEEELALQQKESEREQLLKVKEKETQELLKQKKKEQLALLEKDKNDKKIKAEKDKEIVETQKREKINTIIAAEKDVIKDKDRLIIKTDPIYFDYDLWYIRKESKPILNRVVDLMNKYPGMTIEVGSHTDNRGNNNYNLNLSSNRAASTKAYFISQGIAEKRIVSKGYGETVQIIPCEPSESCTEEQHELNRRSEFVIKNL